MSKVGGDGMGLPLSRAFVTTQVTSLLSHDGVAVVLKSSRVVPHIRSGSALLAPCPEPKLKQFESLRALLVRSCGFYLFNLNFSYLKNGLFISINNEGMLAFSYENGISQGFPPRCSPQTH